MKPADCLEAFTVRLRNSPRNGAVFNPWWDVDPENDSNSEAPRIRRKQLKSYLEDRLGRAGVALIGEALGYRGGHFTGIPMTSERILLGGHRQNGIDPEDVLLSTKPRRTSKPAIAKDGFAEPTATLVWGAMQKLQLPPTAWVLWNAFPWHPFDRRKGMLSNRCPTPAELKHGLEVLREFLRIFPCRKILALGRLAAAQILGLGFQPLQIRHPASGGAREFRGQIIQVLADFQTAER